VQGEQPIPLVFLGPSLAWAEAQAICPGEYHPPVVRGDLPALAGSTPRAVVVIDGGFEHVRAVSPKEILATLDAGHRVYGASSIGALRAVELESFGMVGVGRIADWYRRGLVDADDEVALLFDGQTLAALTVPLICMRVAFDQAVAKGLVNEAESASLLEAARHTHYRDRTYPEVVERGGLAPTRRERLLRFLLHEASDQKADDARTVLALVAAGGRRAERTARDLPLRPDAPRPGPRLRDLAPARKCGDRQSVRTVPAAVTERKLEGVRRLAGITRVADVTGLDVLGIPNCIAIRPSRDAYCNSAYSGKGLHLADARVGAQMEALEMACGHDDRVEMEVATWHELRGRGVAAIHPDSLIPYADAPHDLANTALEWVTGWDIGTGMSVRVPADAVFFRRDGRRTYWKISSNGLASGNVLAEAIAHGLAEVIERDAETMLRLATEYAPYPRLMQAVAGPQRVAAPPGALAPPHTFPFVRIATLPEPLRGMAERMGSEGRRVALRCITSDVNVPTLLCAMLEKIGDERRQYLHYGAGAHLDPLIAARRAITEAAQSRVTAIQGAREDLGAGAIAPSDPPAEWFGDEPRGIAFDELPATRHPDVRDDIAEMLRRLAAAGLEQAVAVDLSNPAVGFPVVKVIVPGLELAFHNLDPARIPLGWRARRYFAPAHMHESPTTPA
jgi:ribosomal protein S12 methylthiotransferase accessory factor